MSVIFLKSVIEGMALHFAYLGMDMKTSSATPLLGVLGANWEFGKGLFVTWEFGLL